MCNLHVMRQITNFYINCIVVCVRSNMDDKRDIPETLEISDEARQKIEDYDKQQREKKFNRQNRRKPFQNRGRGNVKEHEIRFFLLNKEWHLSSYGFILTICNKYSAA